MDENTALMREWLPPSPTSKTFFTSFPEGNEPITSVSVSQITNEARNESISFRSHQDSGTIDVKQCDVSIIKNDVPLNHLTDINRKGGGGGGLGDRIAARAAGFNAPRLNTECIIRSSDQSLNEMKSPYITIPPGISPTALLESPVFLSNSLTQASPTTGKYPFFPDGNLRGTVMVSSGLSKEDFFDDVDGSAFAFKPHLEQGFNFSLGTSSKIGQVMNNRAFPNIDVTVSSENCLQSFISSQVRPRSELPQRTAGEETRCIDTVSGTAEHSPPLSDQQDDEEEQQAADDTVAGGTAADLEDDGYNWRKYGQKQVKGSEFPRSYFKCTHMTCPVKKKVERSREGDLTEIIYTGEHNHPKPMLNRRPSTGLNQFDDINELEKGDDNKPSVYGAGQNGHPQWRNGSFETMNSELRNSSPPLQIRNGAVVESREAVDPSSTFSNEEDVSVTVGSASIANDVEGDEPESKRRKVEAYAAEIGSGATRAVREPRVVVQTASDVDILDDGYRWRKYGQKVVKGNPNPRSYYKCTSVGCTVRKHVERASHDLKSVITTYEGKHNHEVPPARNSSHVNSSTSVAFASQSQNFIQRSESSQVSNMGRYDRAPPNLNSFIMPMMQQQQQQQQQLQPFIPRLPMGMNQASLTNFSMPVHPYLMQHQQQQIQQRRATDMGLTMPKVDAKLEPNSDPNLYISNGSTVYHQVI